MTGLPGVRDPIALLEWIALGIVAACILAVTCHGVSDHRDAQQLKATIAAYRDTAQEARLSRDSAVHVATEMQRYAEAQHALTVTAELRADSTARVAAAWHARVRVADATHVAVTRGDTTVIYAVPPEIPARIKADSDAYLDLAAFAQHEQRELDVKTIENRALWKVVAEDSVRFRATVAQLDAWPAEADRRHRAGIRQGVVIGAIGAVAAKLLLAAVLR